MKRASALLGCAFVVLCLLDSPCAAQLALKPELRIEPTESIERDAPRLPGPLSVRPTKESEAIRRAFENLPTNRALPKKYYSPPDDEIMIYEISNGCPLVFLNFNISSFQIIYRDRDLDALVAKPSPLQQDICDCRLIRGDYATCAKQHILAHSRHAPPGSILSNMIFVRVTDNATFEHLYEQVLKRIRANPAIALDSRQQTDSSPTQGGGPPPGGDNGGTPPPNSDQPKGLSAKEAEADDCERKRKICFDEKEKKFSIEFSVKCKNTPEISFSTEGEGTLKMGHVSISLSKD